MGTKILYMSQCFAMRFELVRGMHGNKAAVLWAGITQHTYMFPAELLAHANAQIMHSRASYSTAGLRPHLYYFLKICDL
jgi:hypothetical protein